MSVQIAILGRVVRPGMRFQHRRWVVGLPDGTVRADTCTITAVRRGIVHYRNESGSVAQRYPSGLVTDIDRWLDEAA